MDNDEDYINPTIKAFMAALLGTNAVAAMIGNSLIWIVLFNSKPNSSTDYFVMAVALFDCFGGVLISTIEALKLFISTLNSTLLCRLLGYTTYVFSIASSIWLTIIALDRYLKICRPHSNAMTPGKAYRVCIVVTILCILIPAPSSFVGEFDAEENQCKYTTIHSILELLMMALFIALFLSAFIAYGSIVRRLRSRHTVHERRQHTSSISGLPRAKTTVIGINSIKESEHNEKEGIRLSVMVKHPMGDRAASSLACPSPKVNQQISHDGNCSIAFNNASQSVTSSSNKLTNSVKIPSTSSHHWRHEETKDMCSQEMSPDTSLHRKGRQQIFLRPSILLNDNIECNKSHPSQLELKSTEPNPANSADDNSSKGGSSRKRSAPDPNRRNKSRNEMYQSRLYRVSLIAFLITFTYIVTWIITWLAMGRIIPIWLQFLYLLNSSSNPIIYAVLSQKFREAIKRFMGSKLRRNQSTI